MATAGHIRHPPMYIDVASPDAEAQIKVGPDFRIRAPGRSDAPIRVKSKASLLGFETQEIIVRGLAASTQYTKAISHAAH